MMVTLGSFLGRPRRVRLTVLSLVGLVGSFVTFTAHPAAAYDWCSVDPVFTFQRAGLLTSQVVDVQVLVPLSALPLASAAALSVSVPQGVASHEDLNTSTSLFELYTTINTTANISTQRYPVTFGLLVPSGATSFPVRMLITDPQSGRVTTADGWSGEPFSSMVQVGP